MVQRYVKKTSRSRRKSPVQFRGRIVGRKEGLVQLELPISEILAGVRDAIEAVAGEAGLLVIKALIDEEAEQVAGPRYQHDPGRRVSRWGEEEGSVIFAGRKVALPRPRLRRKGGGEVPLTRYQLFRANGRMQQAVTPRIVAGVAMRNYAQVLDAVCDGYGIEKSSVSRHWQAASSEQLRQMLERPLGELDLAALMIDGIEFQKVLLVVALGIDSSGRKHVLGWWPGATETATVCKNLLADLMRRGLATDRPYLFVLDGAKALRKAVKATFGEQALIQRCQEHKERNILDQLPPEHQGVVRQRLRAAWQMKHYADAHAALMKLCDYLHDLNPAAAASLEEGMEETLTLHRLGVPEPLRKTLRSTNPIESCFSMTRELCRNVKRWQSVEMVQRWAGTMLWEAERRFHRVRGHRELAHLLAVLRDPTAKQLAA